MATKRIIITVGGTGGHVFPALALARQLQKDPEWNILFVGGGLLSNRYFERDKFSFHEVACGSISPLKPLSSLRSVWRIFKGLWQSKRLMKEFNPDLVVGFGSYHTLPALIAAKWLKVPIILHEANRIPGKVNRLFSRYAALTGVHFPDTVDLLKGPVLHVPIPLREGFKKGAIPQEQACSYFNLENGMETLLIFGGSQGAQSINRLVSSAVEKLPRQLSKRLQILHFTGDARSAQQLQESYGKMGIRSCVKDFETRMDLAWQAANLMISRSGAGTVAEQLEFEVPGILIPYPHAMDNHQESNADFMVETVEGAVKLNEKDLDGEGLAFELGTLLEGEGQRIKAMRHSMKNYKNQSEMQDLCSIITNKKY